VMLTRVKALPPCGIVKILVCFMGLTVLGSEPVASANEMQEYGTGETSMSADAVREALNTHRDELMSLPGVVGTGLGLCDNQPCIKVFVTKQSADLEERVKAILEGYPVVIQETGRFRTRPENLD
jgi:hypothetical protein